MRSYVLPDWWDDEMASNVSDLALAETYIAKQLGFSTAELRQPGTPLSPPPITEIRFKRYKNQIDEKVLASAIVAWRAAQIVVQALAVQVPPFPGPFSAREIRESILRHSESVDLDSLLRFCWNSGIIVLQLAHRPPQSKGFDGLAAVVDDRPVIALASGRDSPAWLAFHVAHELGHIMLRHVHSQGSPLIDKSLASASGQDVHEEEADRFALEVLAGRTEPRIRNLGATASRLAVIAAVSAPRIGVDPGVYALLYAKSNNRWGVAQNALKELDLDSGGQARVAALLEEYVDSSQLSEADEQFLGVLRRQ